MGDVLLRAERPISQYVLDRASDLGFKGMYIYDKLSEGIESATGLPLDLQLQVMQSLKELNYDDCAFFASKLVECLMGADTIVTDLTSLQSYDDYTYRHCLNVASYCAVVGIKLGYSMERLEKLVLAALLHDIGKARIPIEIINKPGKLTKEEYDLVKKHPELGYEMLKDKESIPSVVRVSILSHHENEDGSGYPNGLDGSRIYEFAKVIHLCDVYDALICKRVYKNQMDPNYVVEYLRGNANLMFSEQITEVFLQNVEIYPSGVQVHLSDGNLGIVVRHSKGFPTRPLVRLLNGREINLLEKNDIMITDFAF